MSTSTGLGFASVILLLDVPQLPAIFAANVCRAFRTAANELKSITARDIIYPNNRSKGVLRKQLPKQQQQLLLEQQQQLLEQLQQLMKQQQQQPLEQQQLLLREQQLQQRIYKEFRNKNYIPLFRLLEDSPERKA
ncbi:hypothetical protein, conserved [Eimeria necatrix]|uniref:Uncharacterized protein n=1 Tax=Eimeria necatrix TaxID=51315 RepID=U6N5C5_9EIME|nr:hypothetical protein, conserved [Eimeria necatrix]CDJ69095.1 hypothetical protein, conserved [Eimeria necatrix]